MISLRQSRLRDNPGGPLITDCTQGRVEFSSATFDNWVCKTSNYLRLELDCEPGTTVHLDLPLHWMTAVWLVTCWENGLHIVTGAADLTVTTRDSDHERVVRVTADAFGMSPPASTGDNFPADARAMPDQRILTAEPGTVLGTDLAKFTVTARTFATTVGLTASGRLLTDVPPDSAAGIAAAIAAPLAVAASVVYGNSSVDRSGEAITAVALGQPQR